MTAAPESIPTRHARRMAHAPRPMPVWLQVGVVLLLLWNGLQAIVHLNGPSLTANTDQAAPSTAPQAQFEYFYQPDRLHSAPPQERNAYDPYGAVRAMSSGSQLATFQYAGYYAHAPGTMTATVVHAQDATLGRWVERDPLPAK